MDARRGLGVPGVAGQRLGSCGHRAAGAPTADMRTRPHRGPSRHRFVAAAAALALVAAMCPASAGAAAPEMVTCGEVIAHSIVVANNLSCGFGQTGLTVGANGITIDLAGHRLSGVNASALSSTGRSYVTVENGSLSDNAIALRLSGDRHDTVRNVTASGGGEGAGVWLSGGSQNSVLGSTLSSGPECCAPLELNNETGDVIGGNTALGYKGLQIGGPDNQVTRNTTPRIDVTGAGNLIGGNVITPDPPVLAPGLIIEGNQNSVTGNHVSSGTTSSGQAEQFPEGISVTGTGNMLRGNTANNSVGDGIHVEKSGNTLVANFANTNGAFGIEAVSGVIDGGQNRASGNGNPAQCLNIDCSAPAVPGPTGSTPAPPGTGAGATHRGLIPVHAVAFLQLTRVEISGAPFRAAKSGPGLKRHGSAGVLLTYRLAAAAKVTFRVERRHTIHGHTHWTMLTGSLSWTSPAGTTRLRFSGRLDGKALPSGRYRLVLTPHDRDGHILPAIRSSPFTIKH